MAGGGGASSQRCSDGREHCSSQRCCDVGRQRTVACSVLAALLQQRAGRRNVAAMASNALDVATLLRWLATCWTSQRCCDGRQRAGPRGVLLRCSAARWASECCCDVQQRYNSGQRCAAVFLFCFFFFLPDNLKREKEWRKREVLTLAL
jgi:hypothetical protein